MAQLKRQLTAVRGGSAAAEDSVSGLRKEKEKVEEAARQAETLVAGLRSKLGQAEQRADEAEAKRKDLQKRVDELSIQTEDLNRKLRAERAANQDASGSSSSGDAKVKRLEEEITKLEAKNNSAQARILDLSRQLETAEAGKGKTGNENTGKEKELEIKVRKRKFGECVTDSFFFLQMRAAVERANRNEERASELEAAKKKLSEQLDKVENDLLTTRNKLTNSLAASATGDASQALATRLRETEDKLDKAELASKGMAAKLQAALDAEGEARRREAKAIEECRKQEELALKQKGQVSKNCEKVQFIALKRFLLVGGFVAPVGVVGQRARCRKRQRRQGRGGEREAGARNCRTEEQAANEREQARGDGARSEKGQGGARQVRRSGRGPAAQDPEPERCLCLDRRCRQRR